MISLMYPDNMPTKNGYYMTIHCFKGELLYKSFMWCSIKKWTYRFNPEVIKYYPDTYSKYYTECNKIFDESFLPFQ